MVFDADTAMKVDLPCGPATEGQTQLRKASCVGEEKMAEYGVSCGWECRLEEREVLWSLRIATEAKKRGNSQHDSGWLSVTSSEDQEARASLYYLNDKLGNDPYVQLGSDNSSPKASKFDR